MPIYEYKCLKNGHVFEAFQSITEEPLKICRICQEPAEKLISSSSFQLKGTGWYVTDYKNTAKTAPKATEAESKPASSESTSSENKQLIKEEPKK